MQLFLNIFDLLFKNDRSKAVPKLRKLGVATILLHDIGHGPFSHMSESIFDYDHEDLSIEIIKKNFGNILKDEGIEPDDLSKIIKKRTTDQKKVITQLVSSSLDVDRLDYLARDIYFTGVGFGGIDLNRIIRTMTIYKEKKAKFLNGYIVIEAKGVHAIESYLLTRSLMYNDVYYHKTTRCVEMIVKNIFRRVLELSKEKKIDLPTQLSFITEERKINSIDLTDLDDFYIYSKILEWSKYKDKILSELCQRIINRNLFKSIESNKGSEPFIRRIDDIIRIYKKNGYEEEQIEYNYSIDSPQNRPYNPIKSITKREDVEQSLKENIYVKTKDGDCKEISEVSPVIRALNNLSGVSRLYVPSKVYPEIQGLLEN